MFSFILLQHLFDFIAHETTLLKLTEKIRHGNQQQNLFIF